MPIVRIRFKDRVTWVLTVSEDSEKEIETERERDENGAGTEVGQMSALSCRLRMHRRSQCRGGRRRRGSWLDSVYRCPKSEFKVEVEVVRRET